MERIEVIAEVANAHQGDPQQAIEIALLAARAGADAVKFQVYFADELLVKSHPKYEHFSNQAFSAAEWEDIITKVKSEGARIYCDVFGVGALRLAQMQRVDGYKIHSSDLNNTFLLRELSKLPGDLFLSVGGSTTFEIAYALRMLSSAKGSEARVVLLHGFQSYPTAVEDSNLKRISELSSWFGSQCEVGYMDHVDGGDPYATIVPQMAVAAGARVIEKHVTLNRSAQGVDYYSSINVSNLSDFIAAIRLAESACGESGIVFAPSERKYREVMKKHWVTVSALADGHVLTEADLAMKQVAHQNSASVEYEKLINRPLVHNVPEEHPLTRQDLSVQTTALIVARSKSQRLPGKATLDVAGVPALEHLFRRIKQAKKVDSVIFCTTNEPEDDELVALAEKNGLSSYRGPVENVLERMLGALQGKECDLVLRITGDDILVDPEYADRAIEWHLNTNSEYSDLKDLPSGTEVEIFDRELLERILWLAHDSEGTEYLTSYVTHQSDQFRVSKVPVDPNHRKPWRLTIDTPEDYEVVCKLLESMRDQGRQFDYRMDDIVNFFEGNAAVLERNNQTRMKNLPEHVRTGFDWGRLLEPAIDSD